MAHLTAVAVGGLTRQKTQAGPRRLATPTAFNIRPSTGFQRRFPRSDSSARRDRATHWTRPFLPANRRQLRSESRLRPPAAACQLAMSVTTSVCSARVCASGENPGVGSQGGGAGGNAAAGRIWFLCYVSMLSSQRPQVARNSVLNSPKSLCHTRLQQGSSLRSNFHLQRCRLMADAPHPRPRANHSLPARLPCRKCWARPAGSAENARDWSVTPSHASRFAAVAQRKRQSVQLGIRKSPSAMQLGPHRRRTECCGSLVNEVASSVVDLHDFDVGVHGVINQPAIARGRATSSNDFRSAATPHRAATKDAPTIKTAPSA